MEILEQNAAYVVCIKPAGIPSQGEGLDAMPVRLAAEVGGEIYPVHRLDQAVGGVMVYARTKQAAAALSRAIQEGRMEKDYLAVLTKPMAEASGTLRDLLYHDRVKNKTYVVKRKRNGVKEAVLDYETLASGAEGTLVRVHLHTGRTHQIRVQFASRGMPLVGDGKYGSRKNAASPTLWSYALTLPMGGAIARIRALPEAAGVWAPFEQALRMLT